MNNSPLLVLFLLIVTSTADLEKESEALLDFASRVTHRRPLKWSHSSPVCTSWLGVTCGHNVSHIISLRLPGFGLAGPIPPHTLSRLPSLQTLSLRSNRLSGPLLPTSLPTSLTSLNLQSNSFSGPLPSSISNLTQLTTLNLSNNSLSGHLPDFTLPNLRHLNLSFNRLTGVIPPNLLRFPQSAFSGNTFVAAANKKLSKSEILAITISGVLLTFVLVGAFMVFFFRGGKKEEYKKEVKIEEKREDGNRLVFFEGCSFEFDLEDLLRASAEVLGKGTHGTAYRAVLEDAGTVVVKRLKEVGVGKREFEVQMEMVGRIKHENVVELRAYYYSKDEKLMVYDFYAQGSVSSLLHGMIFVFLGFAKFNSPILEESNTMLICKMPS